MEPFVRPATSETPAVTLDPASQKFSIIGHSFPEDASLFYNPILAWLAGYAQAPAAKTQLTFKLDYFNTASQKMIVDILLRLNDMFHAGHKVSVVWFFAEDDESIEEAGEEFAEMVEMPFEVACSEE